MQNQKDDGSLSFLAIEPDKSSRRFNCSETTQQKLINTSFWIVDYIDEIKTKHGEGRFLVKIKPEKESPESDAKKFFTNSAEIKYILGKIREHNAFPRRVTMRAEGNRYFIE